MRSETSRIGSECVLKKTLRPDFEVSDLILDFRRPFFESFVSDFEHNNLKDEVSDLIFDM
jgi:hypothetical protein